MQNNYKQKTQSRGHRGISPILATVVLLGITVVAGGLV
ncbi:MAG: archaellin/type IV pilin N-terminal domain-containing protein, partial [Nanoarchaeota archaeon]